MLPFLIPLVLAAAPIPEVSGTFAGTSGEAKVRLTLFAQPYSEYERKKNPQFKEQTEMSGLWVAELIKKRGENTTCKAKEEVIYPLQGRRIGNQVYLYSQEMQDGLPFRAHVFKITIPPQGVGGEIEILEDDFLLFSGKIFNSKFKLKRQK